MQVLLQVLWLVMANVTRLLYTNEFTSAYLDYHWVGGVTNTTASIRVTVLPQMYERVTQKHKAYLELTLSGGSMEHEPVQVYL